MRTIRNSLLAMLALFVAGCARHPMPDMLSAETLAGHGQDTLTIRWRSPHGSTRQAKTRQHVDTLKTADIRGLLRVKEQVEQVAGPLRTALLIAEGDDPNGFAFGVKGKRYIAINVGMINLVASDADAVAALIGHELAHLYLDHSNQRREREEGRAVTTTALGFALGMIGVPFAFVDFTTDTIGKSFTREEERDADSQGLTYMVKAGFDPWGAVRLQEQMGVASSTSPIPFLSTHPSSDERVENMKRLVRELQK